MQQPRWLIPTRPSTAYPVIRHVHTASQLHACRGWSFYRQGSRQTAGSHPWNLRELSLICRCVAEYPCFPPVTMLLTGQHTLESEGERAWVKHNPSRWDWPLSLQGASSPISSAIGDPSVGMASSPQPAGKSVATRVNLPSAPVLVDTLSLSTQRGLEQRSWASAAQHGVDLLHTSRC